MSKIPHGRFHFAAQPMKASAWLDSSAIHPQADEELRCLREEVIALKVSLADRETALAKAALHAEQTHKRWHEESHAAEAIRLAAAEERWRQQSANALAEVTARCEAAEALLAQLREEAARARNDVVRDGLLAKRSNYETEFEQSFLSMESEPGQESRIVLRPDRIGVADDPFEDGLRESQTHPARAVFVSLFLAVLAITSYASIESLPQNFLFPFKVAISGSDPTAGRSGAPNAAAPVQSTNVTQQVAVVVRDVNVRANPSNTAPVVATLPHGLKVATMERRGNWTLVNTKGDGRNIAREGWVYSSFLKGESSTH
jgi:hypothetical protein